MLARWIDRPRWFAQKVAYVLHHCGATKEVNRSGNSRIYQWIDPKKESAPNPKMKKSKLIGAIAWFLCAFALSSLSTTVAAEPTSRTSDDVVSVLFVGDIMLDGGPGHALNTGRDPFAACSELLLSRISRLAI